MLPQHLYGSYKRYKTDTDRFAQWLVETSYQCGYKANTSPPDVPKRNQATSPNPPKHKVKLSEIVAMATAISNSTLPIPSAAIAIAKRAISLRKKCSAWFKGRANDAAGDSSHEYFISVMESACERLDRTEKQQLKRSDIKADTLRQADVAGKLGNQFATLAVEELAGLTSTVRAQKENKNQYEVDEDVDNGEEGPRTMIFFRIFCLFEDMNNLRRFIKQTWTEYRDGKIDLISASVVTDTGLLLSKPLIEECADGCPVKLDDDELQGFVYIALCMSNGINYEARADPTVPYNTDASKLAEWCYLPTSSLLKSFANVLQPGQVPVYRKGHFGTYDPKAKRAAMTAGQQFHEDKLILLELLADFAYLQRMEVRLPATDDITAGMVEFCRTKKTSLSLAFASQVFLDAHHVLRYHENKAYNDLRIAGLRINKIIEEYWTLSKSMPKPPFWPKEGDEVIKEIAMTVDAWVLDDALVEFKKASLDKKMRVQVGDKHAFIKQHPTLCGVYKFHLALRMQDTGLQLINQWFDVVQVAYLYNLAQQQIPTKLTWPDMDCFLDIHGDSKIFIGNRPKTAEVSMNRLQISAGVKSPSGLAPNRREMDSSQIATGKPRLLKPTTAVANMFRGRYDGTNDRAKISIKNIDELLDEIGQAFSSQDKGTSGRLLVRQKWQQSHKISTLQLLVAIKEALYAEEPKLLFNYFGMHKRCIDILRLIREKEHHKFVQYFTDRYMPDETMISNLVLLIHHVAMMSAAANKQMGIVPQGKGMTVTSRIVKSAGDVMRDYLVKNGDVAVKELKVFCRNKIVQNIPETEEQEKEDMYWFALEDILDPKVMASLQTGIPLV